MAGDDLTAQELQTLASFSAPTVPDHVDPLHFAKLLSLALLKQEEGGPVVTQAGMDILNGFDHVRSTTPQR
ncbi:hypothetical protein ABIB57_003996 [Devosia sp. UYZn731]|uniref:hypothetical protein n=1 Tax=Devosia sp. UYZn731 TaxID=3156345 RepID=UPI00339A33A8